MIMKFGSAMLSQNTTIYPKIEEMMITSVLRYVYIVSRILGSVPIVTTNFYIFLSIWLKFNTVYLLIKLVR